MIVLILIVIFFVLALYLIISGIVSILNAHKNDAFDGYIVSICSNMTGNNAEIKYKESSDDSVFKTVIIPVSKNFYNRYKVNDSVKIIKKDGEIKISKPINILSGFGKILLGMICVYLLVLLYKYYIKMKKKQDIKTKIKMFEEIKRERKDAVLKAKYKVIDEYVKEMKQHYSNRPYPDLLKEMIRSQEARTVIPELIERTDFTEEIKRERKDAVLQAKNKAISQAIEELKNRYLDRPIPDSIQNTIKRLSENLNK